MASTRPTRFAKVRDDHRTETAEDYVEAVADILQRQGECRVKDLAKMMGVSHVTVTRIVARLEEEGYIETEPYQPVRLTRRGERLAAESRHRHEIVYSFLRAIGVPEKDAAHDTEGIEHHVGKATLARMQAYLRKQKGSTL